MFNAFLSVSVGLDSGRASIVKPSCLLSYSVLGHFICLLKKKKVKKSFGR